MGKEESAAVWPQPQVRLRPGGSDLVALGGTTFLVMAAVSLRVACTHRLTFVFLGWNLFLAWLPLLFTFALEAAAARRWARVPTLALGMSWLLLFPNAPYLATDLIHLGRSGGMPRGFDAVILALAGGTGILLGYVSLERVERLVASRWGRGQGLALAGSVLILSALGIQLGRVQRWNSWDIVRQPLAIAHDAWAQVIDPVPLRAELAFAAILTLGYLAWRMARTSASVFRRSG